MDPHGLLEDYKRNKREDFRYIVQLLNKDRKWETVVRDLKNYRIPIYLPERVLERMSMHSSPSEILLDELIIRSCTVGHFMEILEDGKCLDALSVLMNLDTIEIKVQPGDNDQVIYIEEGGELKLKCYAIGRPPLSYQWYCFNEPLKEATQPELTIKNFGEINDGDYYCIVSNALSNKSTNLKMSNEVTCKLMESPPEFIQQMERELTVSSGNYVELIVQVHPSKCKLQWLKGNTVLDGESSNILKIKAITKSHEGIYKCVAKNSVGEVFSSSCELKVQVHGHGYSRNLAHAKVALLIANEKYQNHKWLRTPCNDVIQLARILKELNFHVITLINLSLVEMRNAVIWFCQKVPPKSYAFFYYCGHGFEICNNKFMMPVDCPDVSSFLMADCFCDQELIQHAMMKTTKLKLLVIILDMCLDNPDRTQNPKIFEEKTPIFVYKCKDRRCNMIRSFATSSYQSAYEKAEDSNGLYMKCLMNYLSNDVPLLENLHDAHEDFARNKFEKQKPSVSSDDCRRYKLTDPVRGAPAFDKAILDFTTISEVVRLQFESVGRECQLIVKPHQDYILNAVDLIFPEWIDMRNWIIALDAPAVIDDFTWLQMDDGPFRLTLYNIQRAKSDICLTIKLHHLDRSRMMDYCLLDLGRPFMSKAELWFQAQVNDQDMTVNR